MATREMNVILAATPPGLASEGFLITGTGQSREVRRFCFGADAFPQAQYPARPAVLTLDIITCTPKSVKPIFSIPTPLACICSLFYLLSTL